MKHIRPLPRQDPSCPLCKSNQSLLHVLNNCSMAISLRRYNICHDKILHEISTVVRAHLSPSASMAVDIGEGYAFPMHIVPTDLRPDLVWWEDDARVLYLLELTVCYETNFEEAARKVFAGIMRQPAADRLSQTRQEKMNSIPLSQADLLISWHLKRSHSYSSSHKSQAAEQL